MGPGPSNSTNTAGLEQSAINGFILEVLDTPSNTYATWAAANAGGQVPELDFNGNGVRQRRRVLHGRHPRRPGRHPAPGEQRRQLDIHDPLRPDRNGWLLEIPGIRGPGHWDDLDDGDTEVQVLTGPDQLELTLPASATGRKFVRLVVVTS